jgi:ubiquinone/menaquinone biosynthesis C-methylase UbiE
MACFWTLNGDDKSWTSWAENMASAPVSSLVEEVIATRKAANPGWAVDIGCGTGRAFIPLAEAGFQVVGVDPVIRGLQFGRERARLSRMPAFPLQASATRLPLKSASISYVLAIGTLFHLSITEVKDALQEIRRILRPDGEGLLHFLDSDDWRRALARQIHPEEAPVPSYQAVVTCFCSRETIEEWLKKAGLKLMLLELKTSATENGQQRNWLAYCRRCSSS